MYSFLSFSFLFFPFLSFPFFEDINSPIGIYNLLYLLIARSQVWFNGGEIGQYLSGTLPQERGESFYLLSKWRVPGVG